MSNCDPHSRSPCTGLDQTRSGAIDFPWLSIRDRACVWELSRGARGLGAMPHRH